MEIEINSQHFVMLPQKALWWRETRTLILADLHLGKITHFRKEGIALPTSAYKENFHKLDELIRIHSPARLLFLGDLFHHTYNVEWEYFTTWRNSYPTIEMLVVLGNHDILPQEMYDKCNICVHDLFQEETFLFAHHPVKVSGEDAFRFCGHVHPVHSLTSRAKQSLRLPCFVLEPYQMILPSFGVFTGGYNMRIVPERKMYVIAESRIFEVPATHI